MITEKVNTYWGDVRNTKFLGYIPVFDPEYKSCHYYSCENLHPEREYERVVPCYHYYVASDWMSDIERWYSLESLPKDARHDLVLQHQVLRDDFIERFNTMKYIVQFIGCDDGDKIMRFRDQEHAWEYLNSVQYYEEVFDNEFLMEL